MTFAVQFSNVFVKIMLSATIILVLKVEASSKIWLQPKKFGFDLASRATILNYVLREC